MNYAMIELKCQKCPAWWTRRVPSDPGPDAVVLSEDATLLHRGGTNCDGEVVAKVVATVEGEIASVLNRNRLDALRIGEMCRDEEAVIAARASLLGITVDLAAAAIYAERERREERLRLLSPLESLVGLGNTVVPGLSSCNVCVQPLIRFRLDRLEIPPEVAPDFFVTDIKVGRNSQLVSVGGIPATTFSLASRSVRIRSDVCSIAMYVTISVTNQREDARPFQGVLVGHQVTDDEHSREFLPRSCRTHSGDLSVELQEELRRVTEQRTWEWPTGPASSVHLLELLRLGLVARDAEGRYLVTIEGAAWGG